MNTTILAALLFTSPAMAGNFQTTVPHVSSASLFINGNIFATVNPLTPGNTTFHVNGATGDVHLKGKLYFDGPGGEIISPTGGYLGTGWDLPGGTGIGSGAGGLFFVATDASLSGDGTVGNPLTVVGGGPGGIDYGAPQRFYDEVYVSSTLYVSSNVSVTNGVYADKFDAATEMTVVDSTFTFGSPVLAAGLRLKGQDAALGPYNGYGLTTETKASANMVYNFMKLGGSTKVSGIRTQRVGDADDGTFLFNDLMNGTGASIGIKDDEKIVLNGSNGVFLGAAKVYIGNTTPPGSGSGALYCQKTSDGSVYSVAVLTCTAPSCSCNVPTNCTVIFCGAPNCTWTCN